MPSLAWAKSINMPRFQAPTWEETKEGCARGPWLLIAAWISTGLLAVLIPVAKWRNNKDEYYTAYGYAVEYEQVQRAYEEANRNSNGDNNYSYYSTTTCKWYDYACRKATYRYNQGQANNDSRDEDTNDVPNWYLFLGGQTEEGRRDMEEMGNVGNTPAVNFIYAWTLVLFALLVLFGAASMLKAKTPTATLGLVAAIALFFQFLMLNLLLLAQGVIQTDNRAMEDSIYGWFGQTSVLLAYTDFWIMIHATVFTVVLLLRALWQWREQKKKVEEELITESYVQIEAPTLVDRTTAKLI